MTFGGTDRLPCRKHLLARRSAAKFLTRRHEEKAHDVRVEVNDLVSELNVVTLQVFPLQEFLHVEEDIGNLLVNFELRDTMRHRILLRYGTLKLEAVRDRHKRVDKSMAHFSDGYRVHFGYRLLVDRYLAGLDQKVHGLLDIRVEFSLAHEANITQSHDSCGLDIGRQVLMSKNTEKQRHNLFEVLVEALLHISRQVLNKACRQPLALHIKLVVLDRLRNHFNDSTGTDLLSTHRVQQTVEHEARSNSAAGQRAYFAH